MELNQNIIHELNVLNQTLQNAFPYNVVTYRITKTNGTQLPICQDKCFSIYFKFQKNINAIVSLLTYNLPESVCNGPIEILTRCIYENFADILNFNTYPEQYGVYLNYLQMLSSAKGEIVRNNIRNKYELNIAKTLNLNYLNRKTRYRLLKHFTPPFQHLPPIVYNGNLFRSDTFCSAISHNLIPTESRTFEAALTDFLRSYAYMSLYTTAVIQKYYNIPNCNSFNCVYTVGQQLLSTLQRPIFKNNYYFTNV